jgi:subtilisin family serine protease
MGNTRALGARLFAVTLLTASVVLVTSSASTGAPDGAGQAQPNRPYIVVLRESAGAPRTVARQHADEYDAQVSGVYSHAIDGYAAEMTAAEAAEVRSDPDVAYVQADLMLEVSAQPVPTGIQRAFADDNANLDIDGVDDQRIDVDVAVIDTGVANHPDLDVASRADCSTGVCVSGTGLDDNGHGTHVAGTVGAIDNDTGVVGMAPGARIHSVKVCNAAGQCPNSAIVAGVDYVTARAGTIEVVNMSLGGPGTNTSLAQAITRSVNAGVVYAVAAGNEGQNAAGFSPANHPDVVTVSALADSDGSAGGTGGAPSCRPQNQDDTLADFSNFGTVVEVAAPGVCITSTSNTGGLATFSGTSMASPHVAGAAAVLASGANDPTTRAQVLAVRQQIVSTGNSNWTDDSGDGVKEPLLDVHDAALFPPGGGGGGNPPTTVFADDFESAAGGWATNAGGTDTATTGQWQRADPAATSSDVALQQGTPTSGANDLVTGAAAGTDAGTNDIDGGATSVLSGPIALPTGGTLSLSAQYYLAHLSNATNTDLFRISVVTSSGTTQVFQQTGAASNRAGAWGTATANLTPFAGQTVRLLVQAADAGTASLVEAGVDDVRITQQT